MIDRLAMRTMPVLLLLAAAPALGAPLLSEDEAKAKAAAFIRGDVYGYTTMTIASHFKSAQLVTTGSNDCGPISRPLWAVRFQTRLDATRIDGVVHIDAADGSVECSSVPFLRR